MVASIDALGRKRSVEQSVDGELVSQIMGDLTFRTLYASRIT
jgi:hypothetical protein